MVPGASVYLNQSPSENCQLDPVCRSSPRPEETPPYTGSARCPILLVGLIPQPLQGLERQFDHYEELMRQDHLRYTVGLMRVTGPLMQI